MMDKQLTLDIGDGVKPKKPGKVIKFTPRVERFLDAVDDIYQLSAQDADSLAYMTRILVQATMPHKDPGDVPVFGRSNGNFSLTIQPSYIMVNGRPKNIGMPYGALPRLLMAWITTEAVRTKERKIILGNSLSEFMRELDLVPTGGRWGSITRLKEQMNRLFSARVAFQYTGKHPHHDSPGNFGRYINITNEKVLWWDEKHPYQDSLFESHILLEQDFFEEMVNHPVPVDMRALKALKQSPLALDLYTWLTYRMSYLKKPTAIPWKSLQMQFGEDYTRGDNFVAKAKKSLRAIQALYPDLNLDEARGRLILKPSPTHVKQLEKL